MNLALSQTWRWQRTVRCVLLAHCNCCRWESHEQRESFHWIKMNIMFHAYHSFCWYDPTQTHSSLGCTPCLSTSVWHVDRQGDFASVLEKNLGGSIQHALNVKGGESIFCLKSIFYSLPPNWCLKRFYCHPVHSAVAVKNGKWTQWGS